MNLGWSDGGHGGLRAANTDRDEVRRLLRIALDEGRLDAAEHDRRADAARDAKTRGDLVRLTADLPDRKGVRDWHAPLRARGADRDDARGWLDEAAAQGRLAGQEYQRRLAALSAVATYAELTILVDGLPGRPGTPRPERLAGDADREAALTTLAEAVADGRVAPVEAPALEADLRQARRIGDLDARLAAALAGRVSDQDRQGVVEVLAEAHRDGQLDAVEHAARAGRALAAACDAELGQLVADLRGDARRLTESDRQQAADQLRRALDDGRLGLAEFDERVAAAYAAATTAEVEALMADVICPPRPARRGLTDWLFDLVVVNSALVTAPRRRILKMAWTASAAATLLAYGYVAVRHAGPARWLGWLPAFGLLWIERAVVRRLAGPVCARQKAVLARLGVSLDLLRAAQPAINEIAVEYPAVDFYEGKPVRLPWTARIRIVFDGAGPDPALAPSVREEIIRLLWLSPLYPLGEIEFGGSTGTVQLLGAEAQRLRHRYGPRPYGPYRD